MILRQVTAPQVEPITLSDVEAQCRVGSLSDESFSVEMFIRAIRQRAEAVTRRALISQQWELSLDAFPKGRDPLRLPLPPLQTVDSIIYTDTAGVEITLDPLAYRIVKDTPAYIIPVYGLSWPVAQSDKAVVKVTFTCGYGPIAPETSLNVPEAIQQWCLLNVATLYENRESLSVGGRSESILDFTTFADSLLDDYRVRGF